MAGLSREGSVPDKASALLLHFSRRDAAIPDASVLAWARTREWRHAASAVAALNAGRVSQRQLQRYLHYHFAALAALGLQLCGQGRHGRLVSLVTHASDPGTEPDVLDLATMVAWLDRLLHCAAVAAPAHGGEEPTPLLNTSIRREAVVWLVDRNFHQVIVALLLLPVAEQDSGVRQCCLSVLHGLVFRALAVPTCNPIHGTVSGLWGLGQALCRDCFTVSALLCWLARRQGQANDCETEHADEVLNILLSTTYDGGASQREIGQMRWEVVAVPGGGNEWLQFDEARGHMRVSGGFAQRAFEAYLVRTLMLDRLHPAAVAARNEMAALVARVQTAESRGTARSSVSASVPSAATCAALAQASREAVMRYAMRKIPPGMLELAELRPGRPAWTPPGPPERQATAASAASAAAADSDASGTQAAQPPAEADCCAACGASRQDTRLRVCAGCRAVRYCSTECQKAHWRVHRQTCKTMQA